MQNKSINNNTHEILRQRALKLSRITNQQNEKNVEDQFMLCFQLASQTFCLDTDYIKEVLLLKDLTQIPNTPDYVLGVINVRGQIMAVYNTKKLFNVKEVGITDQNKVIILKDKVKDIEFGILVDRILGNINLSLRQIGTLPDNMNDLGKDYIKGITSNGLIVINTKNFIDSPSLIINNK